MDTSETLAFISNRIKMLCNESGISLSELALRGEVSLSTIDAIILCKNRDPRLDTLRRICSVFSISIKDFWLDES